MTTFSILRIKRKRFTGIQGEDHPLDALVIEDAEPLFKRRKNAPSTATDSSGGRGLFRFAATVSSDSFDTDYKTRLIRDRISAFLTHPPPALSRVASSTSLTSLTTSTTSSPSSPNRKLPSSLRAAVRAAALDSGTTSPARRQERVKEFHQESQRARFVIVERNRDATTRASKLAQEIKRGPVPPQVLNSKATPVKQENEMMKIYDAIEESADPSPNVNIIRTEDDSGVNDHFVTMLQEYLSLQDRQTASRPSLVPPPPPVVQSDTIAIEPEEDEDEFVYDVYYRDVGTDTSGQLSGIDTSSEAGMQRIGKLAGLAADELVDNEVESEEEDEADQDSNEENDYRNDYPSDADSEDISNGGSDEEW